jgi:hypothetical protein
MAVWYLQRRLSSSAVSVLPASAIHRPALLDALHDPERFANFIPQTAYPFF